MQYIEVFKTHDSMISDRFLVPEIEIANPPDAIWRARARASSSVHNWEDFLGMTNDDDERTNECVLTCVTCLFFLTMFILIKSKSKSKNLQ